VPLTVRGVIPVLYQGHEVLYGGRVLQKATPSGGGLLRVVPEAFENKAG